MAETKTQKNKSTSEIKNEKKESDDDHAKKEDEKACKQMIVGLVGGISWASSLEYYKVMNEIMNKKSSSHSSKQVMYSIDLDEYVKLLRKNDYDGVKELITDAASRTQKGGANFVVLCSNTAHVAYDTIRSRIPSLPILHIGDCCATRIKEKAFKRCGFIGTKYAMENENIQVSRYKRHGLDIVIPAQQDVRDKLWYYIEKELSLNIITPEAKNYFIEIIKHLVSKQNCQCVILGCTEIPLLVKQNDLIDIPLFDTTLIHAEYAVEVQMGNIDVNAFLPEDEKHSVIEDERTNTKKRKTTT